MARKKATLQEGDKEEHARRLAKSATPLGVIPLRFKCKNSKQKKLLKSVEENTVTIVSGLPGSGKSYTAIYAALNWLKSHPEECEKILILLPVECDTTEEIGFLKGSLEDKLAPWMAVDLYTIEKILKESGQKSEDAKRIVKELLEKEIIQFAPTTFLRGANFDNCVVLVSEAQNHSENSILKILTRIGQNCRLVIQGDKNQISSKTLKKGKEKSGLVIAMEKLQGMDDIGIIEFNDASEIIRNPIISRILYKWDNETYSYLKDAPGVSDEGENRD